MPSWGRVSATFLVALVCLGFRPSAQIPVSSGMERLLSAPYVSLVQGRKLGVLAHHASRDRFGNHLVDLLSRQDGIQLKMIFAPEHGYRSVDDELLPDSIDPVTGLPVYSLYGPRKAPTPEMLAEIDAVVIDLQDVGVRFYTYAATVVNVLQACKAAGKPVILLDRPNPLGGVIVEGAVLDSSLVNGGLTTLAAIPTRHGMTLGELAIFYNETLDVHADLTVVPMSGWKRSMMWNDTGLPWYPSSPALVTEDQVQLYGSFGGLEALNLAVGRGIKNDLAFHTYGAPWITPANAQDLTAALQRLSLPGLTFTAVQWTPERGVFQGELCQGFRIDLKETDACHVIEGFRSLIETLETMKRSLGPGLDFSRATVSLGAPWLRDGIESGVPAGELITRAQQGSGSFLKARANALLY